MRISTGNLTSLEVWEMILTILSAFLPSTLLNCGDVSLYNP